MVGTKTDELHWAVELYWVHTGRGKRKVENANGISARKTAVPSRFFRPCVHTRFDGRRKNQER